MLTALDELERRSNNSHRSHHSDEAAAIAELEQYNPENPDNLAAKTQEEHITTVGGSETGGFHNMLADRINPHELTDARRDEYLSNLWNAFTSKASNGVVTEDDIIDIAIMLNVDCTEENLLDLIDGVPEEVDLDFTVLTELLDKASELEADKYREMDVDRLGSADEVFLSPLAFLWYKTPCATKKPNTVYRLHSKYKIEIKPRMSLLLTTGFFMLLIGAVLLALIAILWRENRFTTEEILVTNLRRTMFELSSLYELFFYDQHEEELMDQVRIIADMMNIFYQHDVSNQERKLMQLAGIMASASSLISDASIIEATSTKPDHFIDAVSQLSDLGVKFDPVSLGSYVNNEESLAGKLEFRNPRGGPPPTRGSNQNCTASEVTVVSANPDYPTMCLSYPNEQDLKQRKKVEQAELLEKIDAKKTQRRLEQRVNGSQDDLTYVPFRVTLLDTDNGMFPVDSVNKSCYDLDLNASSCQTLMESIAKNASGVSLGFGGEKQLYHALPLEGMGASVLLTIPQQTFVDFRQGIQIEAVNYLNWQFVRTTEVVLSRLNKTNGEFVSQATLFRFFDACYLGCDRFPPAQRNTWKSFETGQDSRMITPDYRPEPVAGASRWMNDLEMVLVMERDVKEVRTLGLASLVSIIDNVNEETKGSTEIELFHFEDRPFMRDFDPEVPCGADEDCITDEKQHGVIFRYDCVHCERVKAVERNATIKFLTKRKKGTKTTTTNENGEQVTTPADSETFAQEDNNRDLIYFNTLFDRQHYSKRFNDYDGAQVIGESDFLLNYSIGVLTKVDYSEINDPLMTDIFTSTGSAVGFLIAGVIILLVLSNHSLNQIENDWVTSKAKIEADKQRFGEMVSELIPAAMADRMMRSQSFISDTNNAAIVFADVCSFSENVSQLTPKHIIRYISYVFLVLESVSENCKMSRLCNLGDTFGVYSNEISDADQAAMEATSNPRHKFTPAMRGVRFASIACQLCTAQFAHFPERAKHFKDAFKDRLRSKQPFEFPKLRFGAHTGTSICGIVDTGKAPKFDYFGISAALASRMCATGMAQSVHVTSMMKEAIEQDEEENLVKLVQFDEPRKTIVRGQGTITSFFLKSCAFEVSDAILNKLGVERAATMRTLENFHDRRADDRSSSLSSRPSFHSSQDGTLKSDR